MYEINELGEVFNTKTGRKLKLHLRTGYPSIKLYNNGKAKRHYVHRLVAEKYLPNAENKQYVNHIDGDRTNNKVDNLEWCTHQENCLHRNRVLGKSNEGRNGKKC